MKTEQVQAVTKASKPSLGFGAILTIIFVLAKILGLLSWSWLWVFAPIWIPMALIVLFLLGILGICAFCAAVVVWLERETKPKKKNS